ncbi:hypothetical protein ACSVC9_05480 [Clostridium sp. LBM24168]
MKHFTRNIFLIIIFFTIASVFTGCDEKGDKIKTPLMPKYSDVVVVKSNNGQNVIFNLKEKTLSETGKINNILDMAYNSEKSIYAYIIGKVKNGMVSGNKIEVINGKFKVELNDFFSAGDIKLSPFGSKIAFRSYTDDSISSAQGMRVYDIENNKYVKLKSEVLISGNLYNWLDENRLIYYGNIPGRQNSSNIYIYDLKTDSEKIYLEDTNGYCMYFTNIDGNILYISGIGDDLYLYYYSKENKKVITVDDDIAKIYGSVKDYKNGSIFFIAEQKNGVSAIYEFSYKSGKLNRITYDFPKSIGISSGIAEDEAGNIYFVGSYGGNSEDKMDIFVYSKKDGSISLLSNYEDTYKIYGNQQ